MCRGSYVRRTLFEPNEPGRIGAVLPGAGTRGFVGALVKVLAAQRLLAVGHLADGEVDASPCEQTEGFLPPLGAVT